jgi:hypothetical protein
LHLYAALAEKERALIAGRTKLALAAAKAKGVKLGNPKIDAARYGAVAAIKAEADRAAANVLLIIAEIRKPGATALRPIADALKLARRADATGRTLVCDKRAEYSYARLSSRGPPSSYPVTPFRTARLIGLSESRHEFDTRAFSVLSLRTVSGVEAERGLIVSNESIRRGVVKFGPSTAKNLRAVRPSAHHRRHLVEMAVSIGGRQMHMWRAADSEG